MKLFIAPGHGGVDSGAHDGLSSGDKTDSYEDELNLALGLEIERVAQRCRFVVGMSRRSDVFVSVTEQAHMANRFDADVAISPHHNAASASARGLETLYRTGNAPSQRLARAVQSEIERLTPWSDRGIKQRDDLGFLNHCTMPAVIPEYGFLTNTEEEALVTSPTYRRQAAESTMRAVCAYLGVPYVAETNPEVEPPGYYETLIHAGYTFSRSLTLQCEAARKAIAQDVVEKLGGSASENVALMRKGLDAAIAAQGLEKG